MQLDWAEMQLDAEWKGGWNLRGQTYVSFQEGGLTAGPLWG